MFQKQKPENPVKKVALGAAIAAAAGYMAGLLTAPKSGKETRHDIADATTRSKSAAEKELKKLHTELNDLLNDSKKRGTDLKGKAGKEMSAIADMATASKEKVREVLSALHEGETEDKELKKAIDEASKAIEHIRKFLEK